MTRFHRAPHAEPREEESTAFVLVAHGPPVATSEVERAEEDALEVRVLWDRTPLSTHYLESEGSLVIGDHEDSIARIPESALGAAAFELARATATGYLVRVPAGASARVGKSVRASEVEGPREWETSRGDAVTMTLGSFQLELVHGCAGKTVPRASLAERVRRGATWQVAGAAFLHTALFGIFAYYTPALAGDEASAAGRSEQVGLMRQYLSASAERERDEVKTANPLDDSPGVDAPSGGSRASGSEGAMGKINAALTGGRWGKVGPKDNPDPALGRAGDLPAGFEMIGLVAQSVGDRSAPTAPWGRLDALGSDEANANGHMWGATIDEAAGMGGLGLTGTGEGGDGRSQFIGLNLNDLGVGHGLGRPGTGLGPGGFGIGTDCPGCRLRGHATGVPSMRAGVTTIKTGHMPAEVIQRVVRDNFGRFRSCYETGLRENPSLEGRVVTRFAIDRQGMVSMAQDGGSSLPNPGVVACVVRSFYSLSFPEHDGGIVTVVYPLALRPE